VRIHSLINTTPPPAAVEVSLSIPERDAQDLHLHRLCQAWVGQDDALDGLRHVEIAPPTRPLHRSSSCKARCCRHLHEPQSRCSGASDLSVLQRTFQLESTRSGERGCDICEQKCLPEVDTSGGRGRGYAESCPTRTYAECRGSKGTVQTDEREQWGDSASYGHELQAEASSGYAAWPSHRSCHQRMHIWRL
jgi:hypothetical protein